MKTLLLLFIIFALSTSLSHWLSEAMFNSMWEKYTESTETILGDNPWSHGCTIKMSWAWNEMCDALSPLAILGETGNQKCHIKRGRTVRDRKRRRTFLAVRDMKRYLIQTYGAPDLTRVTRAQVTNLKGLIAFGGYGCPGFSSATGHFDLWNGQYCKHYCVPGTWTTLEDGDYFQACAPRVDIWVIRKPGKCFVASERAYHDCRASSECTGDNVHVISSGKGCSSGQVCCGSGSGSTDTVAPTDSTDPNPSHNRHDYGTCTRNGQTGICKAESTCATGNIASRLCPGPSAIKCCLPSTSASNNYGTCTHNGQQGECKDESTCSTGNIVSRLCPGSSAIKCCLPQVQGTEENEKKTSPSSTGGNNGEVTQAFLEFNKRPIQLRNIHW